MLLSSRNFASGEQEQRTRSDAISKNFCLQFLLQILNFPRLVDFQTTWSKSRDSYLQDKEEMLLKLHNFAALQQTAQSQQQLQFHFGS